MILTKDRSFYKSLVSLSLPIALERLITFLITLTDSIMIGSLGDEAVSGVYVGGLIGTLLVMLVSGIESGITVGASQNFGKKNLDAVRHTVGIGTILILAVGAAVTIISIALPDKIVSLFAKGRGAALASEYLRVLAISFPLLCATGAMSAAMRSIESPKAGTLASLIALIVNLIFDYLLIFGKLGFAKMGIKGAAIATIIARAAELATMLIYVLFIDKKLSLTPKALIKTDKSTALLFIKYTAPLVGGQLVWIFNTLLSTYLIGKSGDSAAMAGFSVASVLNSLSYIVMNGLSGAVGIIIGKTVGEGKLGKIREYSYTTQIIFIVLGIMTAIALQAVKGPFVSLYGISEEAASVAISLINVLSLTIIGTSYQSACLIGLVKSGGDVSFILKNDAFFIFLVVVPLSILAFRLDAPLWLLFLTLKSDQLLKCLPAAIKINRFRWVKDLTDNQSNLNEK